MKESKKEKIRKKVRAKIKARTKAKKKATSSSSPGMASRAARSVRERKYRVRDALRRSGG